MQANSLFVGLHNISSGRLNIWKFDNAWGWNSLSFHVKTGDKEQAVIRTNKQFQSKPECFELLPGERQKFNISASDGWAQLSELMQKQKDVPVELQVQLKIPVFLETSEHQAFYGFISSNWVISDPPHQWAVINKQ